jgi:hypothetical protein
VNDPPVNETPAAGQESHALEPAPAVTTSPRKRSDPFSFAIAAWFVPGLGHFLLDCRGRAIGFFIAVSGLALLGLRMRGNIFPPHAVDPFGTLGFLADAASGVFYLLGRFFEYAGPDVSRAAGDYGTRFIAAAGVVNLIAAFDAYEIAAGRRR